jgi:hypothetical protein
MFKLETLILNMCCRRGLESTRTALLNNVATLGYDHLEFLQRLRTFIYIFIYPLKNDIFG